MRLRPFSTRNSSPPHADRPHAGPFYLSIIFGAAVLAVSIAFLAFISVPDPAKSTNDRRTSAWEPEISPMGAMARGDMPIPRVEDLASRVIGPRLGSRAALGLQGNDRLVHSPTAVDFQSENTIAVNGNFVVMGFNDIRGFLAPPVSVSGYAYSSDGGLTWTDGNQLPTVGPNDQVFGDPDVKTWTHPQTQQVYFFFSSLYVTPTGASSLCLHVSTDGGATWSAPREVTTATSFSDFPDKEFMDVDKETGRIFISWTNFGASVTMRVTYSDDFGLTWVGPTIFSSSGQGSIPRADGSSSNVYVAWRSGSTIRFVRSTNNGASWSSIATIASGLVDPMNPYGSDRIHGFPSMDVDDGNGNIYVVYSSRNMAPDFSEVYFIRSTNGGVSFSSAKAINSNPGNDRGQFFPWVGADETTAGGVAAVWYDQINGTGTSDITDVFHAHSSDGGTTWSCPTPLTDDRFHAEYGNTTSQPNIGDYIQCVLRSGKLYTAFAKTDAPSHLTYAPDSYIDISTGSPAASPISYLGINFTDSGCISSNGYVEDGEDVDLFVTVKQYSGCVGSITGIQGTLTSSTPGVSIINGNASFGNLSGAGSTSTNLTEFGTRINGLLYCGDTLDFLLTLQSSAGTALIPFSMPTGVPKETLLLSQNFDGVTAPALPAGWTNSNFVGANAWRTSTTFAASGPNSAFCADIATTSHSRLSSPVIAVPANCDLLDVTFDVTHNIELDFDRKAWDGALLRVRINGSQIVLAGAFASLFNPFYPWQMNRQSSSAQPLQDLSCWSSNVTPNFNKVHIQFPGLGGQNVELFWDMGTDAFVGTPTGMFVDNVVVKSIDFDCTCTDPPTVAAQPSPLIFSGVPGNQTTCDSIVVVNQGPTTLNILGISGCDTAPFSIDTTSTAHTLPPGDSTKILVCVTPTTNDQDSCEVKIVSNASNSPTTIPVKLGVVTAIGPGVGPLPFNVIAVAPNPFNPMTSVRFTLPSRMAVTAEVWSVDGARVRVLADRRSFGPGENELRWDGRSENGAAVASGVYFIRLKTQLGERVARAVLLK